MAAAAGAKLSIASKLNLLLCKRATSIAAATTTLVQERVLNSSPDRVLPDFFQCILAPPGLVRDLRMTRAFVGRALATNSDVAAWQLSWIVWRVPKSIADRPGAA